MNLKIKGCHTAVEYYSHFEKGFFQYGILFRLNYFGLGKITMSMWVRRFVPDPDTV